MQDWNAYWKGYVRFRLYADSPERFLNLCAHHKILVWNLVCRENSYEMNVTVTGFFKLRGICKKTGSRVKIVGKYGLPFFFYRNKKRKAFFIGIFLGLCILCLLSRHIWNIHVEGNLYNSTQSILKYLDELGVRHGTLKSGLDCTRLAEQIREEFPDMTWVSARISGSRLLLEVKENGTVFSKEPGIETPSDLAADKSGIIVSMITRTGTPLLQPGDVCQKGDVLVSGRIDLLNDSKETVRYEYTRADADVWIQHDLSYYQEFPMEYQKPVYTGEKKKGYVLQAGDYFFTLKGKQKWENFDTVTKLHQAVLTENFRLPLFFGTSTDYAYELETFTYTEAEAKERAKEKLESILALLEEKGVQILANHVKIGIQDKSCAAHGILTVVEKAGVSVPTEILPQPAERNMDTDE